MAPDEKQLTLFGHIEELRRRLLIALAVLGVAVTGSLFFSEKVVNLLASPIGGLQKLQSIEITENIGVYMKVSLLCGVILAFPVIVYELLMFILPGLKPGEKRFVIWSIPMITIFFLGGVAFAFLVMLPAALPFLTNFLGVTTNPRLSNYISFVTNLVFWVGVCFELPLVVYLLARFGVVTPKLLLKYWRQAIVIIAVIAAVVTPTVDPVNMSIMMLPLIVLYFISILFAWFAKRSRNSQETQQSSDQ
jgi:sec-independent protein translocase protein TatC